MFEESNFDRDQTLTEDQVQEQVQGMLAFDREIELAPLKALGTVLAGGHRNDNQVMVDFKRLRVMPGFNPRIRDARHRAHVRKLADSMKANGFYADKPLAVISGFEGAGSKRRVVLFVVEGGCRFEGLDLAISEGAPIQQVPCAIKPRSTSMEDLNIGLVKGNNSLPFRPLELAIIVARHEKMGRNIQQIAHDFGYTETYVTQLQALARAPSAIRALIESGQVPAAVAMESIRNHGTHATEVLNDALDKAKASGSKRITRRDLPVQVYKRTLTKAAPTMVKAMSQIKAHAAFTQLPVELQVTINELIDQITAAKAALPPSDVEPEENPDQMSLTLPGDELPGDEGHLESSPESA